ncbi:hypothetical protein [Salipaludibacillus aurantiacus]|uniref:Uncharacterized protein n=1 Tax=Salipaludibacillus aurantiacus TaxID=1601833 RepID=A0A1H9QCK1_9BACI|nr:hypothetical protein [Salipaludibacillus aurantiacus]SER58148.1 hypothetical protein SAMN05518684_102148 [Salipaludibacillus aurantiacus]
MSHQRYEFARRKCIASLPENVKRLFQFVESKELTLADEALSENHYIQLLQQHSPVLEAADKFKMEPAEVYTAVQRIERYLEDRAASYENKLKFFDMTEELQLHGLCQCNDNVKYYYFYDNN